MIEEPTSFCKGDWVYYPVWIEHDGTEWVREPVWEACEHGSDPSKWLEELQNGPTGKECPDPVEYMSSGRAVCGWHFELVKWRSRVRWARLAEEFAQWRVM
jgi:hypothetical protein